MRLEVRLKTDEVMRITHLYEDNLLLVKELKLENEAIKQKQELLKSEYYKLESSARTKYADVIAELALYKEWVSQYESIEKDLDDIIIQTAESTMRDADGHILDAISHAPTASKRWIQ